VLGLGLRFTEIVEKPVEIECFSLIKILKINVSSGLHRLWVRGPFVEKRAEKPSKTPTFCRF
jgi:hypothetical protein